MARGKKHGDQIQAQVMASLLAGQGVSEIAAEYNLPESTVREWRSSLTPEQFAEVRAKKGAQVETLLFDYLVQILTTLKAQAAVASEREYIIEQPAGELAVLHGVMADKGIRLLEAAERARTATPPQLNPATEGDT